MHTVKITHTTNTNTSVCKALKQRAFLNEKIHFLMDQQRRLQFVRHFDILCCLEKLLSFERPLNFQIRQTARYALSQVLKHGDERPSGCESLCSCYYSETEGFRVACCLGCVLCYAPINVNPVGGGGGSAGKGWGFDKF